MDSRLRRRLQRVLADQLHGDVWQRGDTTEIRIGAADVTDVMRTLHDSEDFRFDVLADLAGVDTGSEMWVVYHLWSAQSPDWLRVIAEGLPRDDPRVPSVTFLWNGAEWAEREAYDMFGIIFEGNRDLRRIYMPPDYTSFPLRKDFYLADDSARSPGEGFRHVEQTHPPAATGRDDTRRLFAHGEGQPAAISASAKTQKTDDLEAGTPPADGGEEPASDGRDLAGRQDAPASRAAGARAGGEEPASDERDLAGRQDAPASRAAGARAGGEEPASDGREQT